LTLSDSGLVLTIDGAVCSFVKNELYDDKDRCIDTYDCGGTMHRVTKSPHFQGGYTWFVAAEGKLNHQIVCGSERESSCGNDVCESANGENEWNCPFDCPYTPQQPSCNACLSSCQGISGCCTGCGCICQDSCGACLP